MERDGFDDPNGRISYESLARILNKAVLCLPSTTALRQRLLVDAPLRRICGWERRSEIPSEPKFSRAVREFAEERLVERSFEGRNPPQARPCAWPRPEF